jgi:hypothetical protein
MLQIRILSQQALKEFLRIVRLLSQLFEIAVFAKKKDVAGHEIPSLPIKCKPSGNFVPVPRANYAIAQA